MPYTPIYALDPGAGQVTYTTTGANPAGMTTTFTVPAGPPSRPAIGAHVHYVAHGTPIREDGTQAYPSVCRAAIVTETNYTDTTGDDTVGLAVLNPTGLFFHGLADGGCRHDEPVAGKLEGGTWHWSHP